MAVDGAAVAGHGALHQPPSSSTVAVAAGSTGLQPERHVLLSRLFVHPSARHRGTARALLRAAVAEARFRGQRAVPDVGKPFAAAIALYEA